MLAARAAALPIPKPRAFKKIIYIGHSLGSVIGNSLNTKYGSDVDATVLTGFSSQILTALPAAFGLILALPAATVQPSRFGGLQAGFLEVSSEPGQQSVFFSGGYDPTLFSYDYMGRGTVSVGEAATVASGIQTATNYTLPVFVVTGQKDALCCNGLGLGLLLSASCESVSTDYLGQTSVLYPNAKDYQWYVVQNAGHCWQLHSAAEATFGVVHTWMAIKGF